MDASGTSVISINSSLDGLAPSAIRAVAHRVLAGERKCARIEITLLSKQAMQRLNAAFLQHDYPTDVISFPLVQPDGSVTGDVYLCRYVAARHARQHGTSVRAEMLRLVAHGVLHVLGWDHPSGTEREDSEMWRRQEAYLAVSP